MRSAHHNPHRGVAGLVQAFPSSSSSCCGVLIAERLLLSFSDGHPNARCSAIKTINTTTTVTVGGEGEEMEEEGCLEQERRWAGKAFRGELGHVCCLLGTCSAKHEPPWLSCRWLVSRKDVEKHETRPSPAHFSLKKVNSPGAPRRKKILL